MKRPLIAAVSAAALLLCACQKDALYVQLPGTAWEYEADGVLTWVVFHDSENASLMQHSTTSGMRQTYQGTYTADGHSVVLTLSGMSSTYKMVRTFSHMKHSSSNHNFTKLATKARASLEGSVWVLTESGNLRIAYFPGSSQCVESIYTDLQRSGTDYGWTGRSASCTQAGDKLDVGSVNAVLYEDFLQTGTYGALLVAAPVEEEGTSSLKGTVWTYNNTGSPVDIPVAIIFNGKDTFTRVSGVWTGNLSAYAVSAYVFLTDSGTYSESGGTISFTVGDETQNCPVSGGSFTLGEKIFKKLDY